MRKTLTALVVAGVLLGSACGDGDDGGDENAEDSADETTSSSAPQQEGEFAEFCEAVISATSAPPEIEAPEPIAEDWATLQQAYEAQQSMDPADPAAQEELAQMQEEAAPATQRVTQFLQDNCNLPGEENMPDAEETSTTAAS
jgi:hypothetical protein